MWPLRKRTAAEPESAAPANQAPHLVLAGFGAQDSLQLTVETQRILARYGKAFTLGLRPAMRSFLRTLKVEAVELDDRFRPGLPYAEAYLDVVATLLERSAVERPVVLLTPGNPLFLNALSRTLLMEARRLGLKVQILPGVSIVDVLINEIGMDVSLFGLQVFDALWLVQRRLPLAPALPAMILNLRGIDRDAVPEVNGAAAPRPDIEPLFDHLLCFYEASQPVALLALRPTGGIAVAQGPLDQIIKREQFAAADCLFIDAVKPASQ
jgi:hypothetical protein